MIANSKNGLSFTNGVALVLSSAICLLLSIIFYGWTSYHSPVDERCTTLLHPNSLNSEIVQYRRENFYRFYNPPSLYRGPSTPERDEAWKRYAPFGLLATKTPGQYAISAANLHMSCLDHLRLAVYGVNVSDTSKALNGQCIETLRRHLVCSCDTTPYLTINLDDTGTKTTVVTGNDHICRDYSLISDWSKRHFRSKHDLLDNFRLVNSDKTERDGSLQVAAHGGDM